jgi:DNA-binding MarR family transcriptional regulator
MRAVLVAQGEFELALARHLGLRPLDLHAMSHLAGTPMGPVELAGRLGISTGSGTELADRLERAGHLHRRRAERDRRRVVLEPDGAAIARLLRALAPLVADLDDLVAGFTDAERDAITRYLVEVAARIRTHASGLDAGQG